MDRNLRIRMLLEAGDKVSRPLRAIGLGARSTSAELEKTRDRLKALERTQGAIGGFRRLKESLQETEQEMGAAQAKVAALAREIRAADAPTKTLTREFERAKAEAGALKRRHAEESTELQRLRSRLSAAGVATSDLGSHERRLKGDIDAANRSIEEQTRRLKARDDRAARFSAARERFGAVQDRSAGLAAGGAAAIGAGVAVGAPLIASDKEARTYQSVMTDIAQKANLSREEARKMGVGLLAAARAANQMPADLQKGVDALAGFGMDPRKAVAMMQPIGRAATAYKADIEDLSKASFSAIDNLKVPIGQTGKLLDVLATAGKEGAFEVKDMAAHFPELTAGYQALGQKGVGAAADLAAALQITRKGAGDSASAANNLVNILAKINTEDTIKNFKQFGIDLPAELKKAAAAGKTPIEAIAELTNRALGGDLSKISFLFGDMQVQQGLRPLIQNLEEFQRIRAKAGGAGGVVDKDFADRMQDAEEQARRLNVAAAALKISVGDRLMPIFTAIRSKLAGAAEAFTAWSNRHPTLSKYLLIGTAALAGFLLLVGTVGIALGAIMGPWAALNALAILSGTTTAGMFLKFGRSLLFPLKIVPLLFRAFTGLAGVIARVGLMMLANPMVALIVGIVAAIAFAGFMIWKHWDTIKAAFKGGIDGIVGTIINFSPMGLLYAGFAALFRWLGFDVPTRLSDAGRMMMQGLANGITSALGGIKDAIMGAGAKVVGWFKEKLGIHSPSRVFMGLGGFLMSGLDAGIAQGEAGPASRVRQLAARLGETDMPPLRLPRLTGALAAGLAMPAIAATPLVPPAPLDPAGTGVRGDAQLGTIYRQVASAIASRPFDTAGEAPGDRLNRLLADNPPGSTPPAIPLSADPLAPEPLAPRPQSTSLPPIDRLVGPSIVPADPGTRLDDLYRRLSTLFPAEVTGLQAPGRLTGQGDVPGLRLDSLVRELAGAMDAGRALPPIAAAPASAIAPPATGRPALAATALPPIEIHIHPPAGASSQDIARAVAQELEKRDRASAARDRSSFRDPGDWSDGR